MNNLDFAVPSVVRGVLKNHTYNPVQEWSSEVLMETVLNNKVELALLANLSKPSERALWLPDAKVEGNILKTRNGMQVVVKEHTAKDLPPQETYALMQFRNFTDNVETLCNSFSQLKQIGTPMIDLATCNEHFTYANTHIRESLLANIRGYHENYKELLENVGSVELQSDFGDILRKVQEPKTYFHPQGKIIPTHDQSYKTGSGLGLLKIFCDENEPLTISAAVKTLSNRFEIDPNPYIAPRLDGRQGWETFTVDSESKIAVNGVGLKGVDGESIEFIKTLDFVDHNGRIYHRLLRLMSDGSTVSIPISFWKRKNSQADPIAFCVLPNVTHPLNLDKIIKNSENPIIVSEDPWLADKLSNKIQIAEEKNVYIFTSWIGGMQGLDRLDTRHLEGRDVVYLTHGKSKECYEVAVRFASELGDPAKLKFLDYFVSEPQLLSSNELFERAKGIGVDVDRLLKKGKTSRPYNKLNHGNDNIKAPELKFLLQPYLPERSLSMLYSPAGLGKSWLSMSIGYAMSLGLIPFEGCESPKPTKVLYLDSEMGENVFRRRLEIMEKVYPCSPVKRGNFVWVSLTTNSIDISTEEGQAQIKTLIADAKSTGTPNTPVSYIIFDNLSTMTGGSDSQRCWMSVFDFIQTLRIHKRGIMVVHHTNKAGHQRGTSLRSVTVDNEFRLSPLPENDYPLGFKLTIEKGRELFGDVLIPRIFGIDLQSKEPQWNVIDSNVDELKKMVKQGRTEDRMDAIESLKKHFSNNELAEMFGVTRNTIYRWSVGK